jgi:ubiquinone/menaquinone biosynthesis C-methylase UbiE
MADKQTQRQRSVWQKAAPRYDRAMAPLERSLFAGSREWIAERAHGRVLEVAIGTGRSLEFYAPGIQLTGVDLSPAMLRRARRRARELDLDPTLRVADVEHLPFEAASFDTVVCALGLCSMPRPGAAVREMTRVLVPGGTLLLFDHIGSSWPPVWVVQWLVERVTILTSGEHLTRRQLPVVKAAGLDVVETERLKAGTVERIRAIRPAG